MRLGLATPASCVSVTSAQSSCNWAPWPLLRTFVRQIFRSFANWNERGALFIAVSGQRERGRASQPKNSFEYNPRLPDTSPHRRHSCPETHRSHEQIPFHRRSCPSRRRGVRPGDLGRNGARATPARRPHGRGARGNVLPPGDRADAAGSALDTEGPGARRPTDGAARGHALVRVL